MAERRYDVLILGGGAAGLAAARLLKKRGRRVLILEGRGRLGGRMWTDPGSLAEPLPLELGAEFVHGEAPVTTRLAREHGLTMVEVPERHFRRDGKSWTDNSGMWERLGRIFAKIPGSIEQSFGQFARQSLSASEAREALHFVEGFHGADPDHISALSLKQSPEEFEKSGRLRRLLGGYASLLRALEDVPALVVARVDAVLWKRGEARVIAYQGGARHELYAPRVIVTLPLGVLQAGLVRFSPELTQTERALHALAMGHALRVGLRFEEEIWKGRAPEAAFWHDSSATAFPVWWGSPLEGRPALTAWAGGPRALSLSKRGMARAVNEAIAQLAGYARVPRSRVLSAANSVRAHDWTHDVYSFGAYSYARVKQKKYFSEFFSPLARTLFFAGEHTILDGENGTVEGALRSGEECARKHF